jgi:hypothetical protein
VLAVPAGADGLARGVEGAMASLAVRGALVAGPVLGLVVAAAFGLLSAHGAALAAVMGVTVALTGGLFAGGFAGYLTGLSRYQHLLSADACEGRWAGRLVVAVRGPTCSSVAAVVDDAFDVIACCDRPSPLVLVHAHELR